MLLTVNSRIGNQPINIENIIVSQLDTEIIFKKDNKILKLDLEKNLKFFNISTDNNLLKLIPITDDIHYNRLPNGKKINKYICSLFGMYRQKINNICIGLRDGYKKELNFFGVKFGIIKHLDDKLELDIGKSNSITWIKKINLLYESNDRKKLIISGDCKESVHQEAASIMKLAKRNLFHQIGIFYSSRTYTFRTKKKK